MIYFIKKNLKYILAILMCVALFVITYIYNSNDEVNSTSNVKKSSVKKEDNTNQDSTLKTVFVDVKGAVNAPGVYELEDGKRVIDAINLAGGLSDNANTINLNLSKKLTDEMYVIVYTKNEIANYKKNNSNNNVSCASNECICPDKNNDACIKQNSNETSSEAKTSSSDKISINNASKEELMNLTGIGESKADAIISYRNENGSFKNIEEIKNVSGIGDSIFEKIKDNITL